MITDIFPQNIILENERALLRPIEESDFDHLLPFSLHEPEIWKYGLLTAAGEDNLRNYLKQAVTNRNEKKEYPFIVFDKKAKAFAGSTRFYDIQQSFLSVQLGFTWYGKNFQQTGLNRHCKLLILSFAFEEWGMERVEFRAHAQNFKSIEAMKAIGCVMEGTLRNHMPTVTGERRDSVVLSILKNEWFNGGKEALLAKAR
jgi:RimJ/RimL family protein N-acetyltransferase